MEQANPRKSGSIAFIGRHLLATAHQALSTTRQSVVARLLSVADSTILRFCAVPKNTLKLWKLSPPAV